MIYASDRLAQHKLKYITMPLEKRKDILLERNVCSLYLADNE